MIEQRVRRPGITRRTFLQILAVAGAAGAVYRFGLSGDSGRDQVVRQSRSLMGTEINLIVCGPDQDGCNRAAQATFDRIASLSSVFSRHDPASELSALNRQGELATLSAELAEVLDLAATISRASDGAFDITVLPLLQLYGRDTLPDEEQVAACLQRVDYRRLERRGDGMALSLPGMGITLDGIAKGYIVDQGVATLRSLGFSNVYVEAGGDLMVSGNKPGGQPWRIGVRQPRARIDEPMTVLSIATPLAVATSGDYMQAFTADLRHHHIIDPRSGRSPARLASATVTAPSVALADGLATAAMVLGPERSLEVLRTFDHCEGLFVDKELRTYRSDDFPG